MWSQNWNVRNVYEFWHSELIEDIKFISYLEFKTWHKILDLDKFGSTFQISYFYEVWYLELRNFLICYLELMILSQISVPQ